MTRDSRSLAAPPRPTPEAPVSGTPTPGEREGSAAPWRGATAWQGVARRLISRRAPSLVGALALLATLGAAASMAHVAREPGWHAPVVLVLGVAVSGLVYGIVRLVLRARALAITELHRTQAVLARHAERLRILHEIDRALLAEEAPEAIAGAVIRPLRELLGVPRAIVNLFDLAANEVEWLAAAGRHRVHRGPGVRYSMQLMGDLDALRRGEAQVIDTHALPLGPEVDALLASGVHVYMVVPMLAGGELIGALSFGGAPGPFPAEQVSIAREAATQLAIVITQARLHERVKRQADDLELRVHERTQELRTAHAALQTTHAELLQSASALQAANRELEAFSYSVSHDLRAPLRAINGFAHILLEEYAPHLADEAQRYLHVVRDNARHMAQLIDDLLTFSRLSRQPLTLQPVACADLVRQVLGELRSEHAGRCVDIALGELPLCQADPGLLKQVFVNLLANALKFTRQCDVAGITIGCREDGGERVYFVQDNGVGFDMQYADKLFGVFQRLHRAEEYEGTGVGLGIVQRIIHRHGGRVWAEAAVNQGATFSFTLGGAPAQD